MVLAAHKDFAVVVLILLEEFVYFMSSSYVRSGGLFVGMLVSASTIPAGYLVSTNFRKALSL